MHTINNVPQSRCRAFLIYGELSKMGRWSKRRWRHAKGLFSLLTSQTTEACECATQHAQTHSHTPLNNTAACTNADMHHPPTVYMAQNHHPFHYKCSQSSTQLYSFSATHNKTQADESSSHADTYATENDSTNIRPSQTHGQVPWDFTGLGREEPVMNCLVRSAESAASRQTSFCWAICRYEYAWESVIQATNTTYI